MGVDPPLLFLSPARPDGRDSGLRIRAQHALRTLRLRYRVHSFHVHSGWGWDGSALPCFPAADPGLVWRRLRHRLGLSAVTEDRCFSRMAQWQLLALARIYGYQRIHLFRAAMIPLAAPLLERTGVKVQLDLDEIESVTRRRLAELADLRKDSHTAQGYRREAAYFEGLEEKWLPRFDRVFLSSEVECERLRQQFPAAQIQVLPNLPREIPNSPTPPCGQAGNLLFVGNLDYYPNRDAVEWLLGEIMPRLAGRGRLLIAGSGGWRPPASADVVDLGSPADLRAAYAQSLVALVPLRAGGGTRVKALEAFAHARTVLATPLGLKGLDVHEGQHVFLAENADQFAQRCLHLLQHPELAHSRGLRAYEWLKAQGGLATWECQLCQ